MSLEGASLSLTGDFSRPSKKEGSLSFVSDIGRPPTTRAFCMMPLYLNFTGVRLSSLQTSHGVNAPLHSGNSGPLSSALRMSSARCKLSTARRATPFSCTGTYCNASAELPALVLCHIFVELAKFHAATKHYRCLYWPKFTVLGCQRLASGGSSVSSLNFRVEACNLVISAAMWARTSEVGRGYVRSLGTSSKFFDQLPNVRNAGVFWCRIG